jgi:hypothetical protein
MKAALCKHLGFALDARLRALACTLRLVLLKQDSGAFANALRNARRVEELKELK